MESLFILIPIAIVVVSIAVIAFVWAVKNGQYDDLDSEGKRILFDDAPDSSRKKSSLESSSKEPPSP